MRHRVYGSHLGRNKNQRTALFKGLVRSLILHGQIQTTESKAKAIKGLVDRVINYSKDKKSHRLLFPILDQKEVTDKLIKDIAPSLKNRVSGYSSIAKIGPRKGDGAMMVRMSLLGSEQEGKKELPQLTSKAVAPKKEKPKSKKLPIRRTSKEKKVSNKLK